MTIYIYIYIYSKEGDRKPPFSIATPPRCKGGTLLFSLNCSTLPLIRTLYCWVVSKEVSSTIFKVFGMTRPGLKPGLPDHWRTLHPLGQWAGKRHVSPGFKNSLFLFQSVGFYKLSSSNIYAHITVMQRVLFRVYIYIYISSPCRAISTDIPDSLQAPFSIIHRFR